MLRMGPRTVVAAPPSEGAKAEADYLPNLCRGLKSGQMVF